MNKARNRPRVRRARDISITHMLMSRKRETARFTGISGLMHVFDRPRRFRGRLRPRRRFPALRRRAQLDIRGRRAWPCQSAHVRHASFSTVPVDGANCQVSQVRRPTAPVGSAARESGVRAGAGPRPRRHAPNNDHAGTHRTTTTPAHTRQRPRRHAPDNDHAGTHRTTRRADDHTSRIRTSARPLARGQNRSHLMSTRTALPRWLIASFSASVSSAMVRLSPMASGTNTGS